MAVMDALMNVGAVTKKGQDIEALGNELKRLMQKFDETTNFILVDGIRGKAQVALNKAYEDVEPSMTKHANRVLSVSSAVKNAATAKANMDQELSGKIKTQM